MAFPNLAIRSAAFKMGAYCSHYNLSNGTYCFLFRTFQIPSTVRPRTNNFIIPDRYNLIALNSFFGIRVAIHNH